VALARHFREAEGLSISEIADRLGRSPATINAYFYDPAGEKARAVTARYVDVLLRSRRRRGTSVNRPGSKWTAFNAIAEHLDCGRRDTSRTNQVQRSFEGHSRRARLAVQRLNLRCVRV
jgi:AcrR family transcriptional regulator